MNIQTTLNIRPHNFRSEGEEMESRKLTELQKMNIENMIAGLMLEKLDLTPSPAAINEFLLSHEFLRGQISAMQLILALSDDPLAVAEF